MARQNGFDSIRLLAALLVIFSHAFLLTSGNYDDEWVHMATGGQTTLGSVAVGAFFVISGLFITASFDRSVSRADFVRKRALRIMPALVVVISLTVFVLGPLLTTLPLDAYFGNRETWTYLGHMVFLPVTAFLPGVFEGNTLPTVNESIWTLKYEVICYAITFFTMMLARRARVIVLAGWIASFLIVRFWPNADFVSGFEYYIVATARMFRFFGTGMLLYLFRDRVMISPRLAWACLAITVAGTQTPVFLEICAVFGGYALIVFGFLAPAAFRQLARRGDWSYGVYVYGWPVQQVTALFIDAARDNAYVNSAISLVCALVLGWLSWTLVEHPALRFKPRRSSPSAGQQAAPE